ncbi:MAG TPA: hypothetical protein VFH99_00600 [Candidatus Saccharimonadales bacterium]|nr:hypothetical protein [Candidatus Saccharimonadales bacterium]
MSKTNKTKLPSTALHEAAQRIGLVIMSGALTLSVLSLPDDAKRIILPTQPLPAWAGESSNANNPIRREREETTPHFISYSEVQRTASRSGRT